MQAYEKKLTLLTFFFLLFFSIPLYAKDATDFCYIAELTGGSCTQLPENKDKQSEDEFSTTIQNLFFNILSSTHKPTIISSYPNNLPQGSETYLILSGSNVDFNDSSQLSFNNSHILVKETIFIAKNKLRVKVSIPHDAPINHYSATVTTRWGATEKIATGADILSITKTSNTPYIINVMPNRLALGTTTAKVFIYGYQTNFTEHSIINFPNANINIIETEVINKHILRATITLNDKTKKGLYGVAVTTGTEIVHNKEIGTLNIFEPFSHPTIESISPSHASQGDKNISLFINAKDTHFNENTYLIFKDAGIDIKSIYVINETQIEVVADIADNAPLGGYDVFTSTGDEVSTLKNGFRIYPPEKISLTPNQANKNEIINITIKGENIYFSEATKVLLDPNSGISLNSSTVIDHNTLQAHIHISNTAKLGDHIISVKSGEQVAVKTFRVNAPIIIAPPPIASLHDFFPKQAQQTDKLILTIEGKNTQFTAQSIVDIKPKNKIIISDLTIINSEKLQVALQINLTEVVGKYDISVTTKGETLVLKNSFTIEETITPPVIPEPILPIKPEPTIPDPIPPVTPDPTTPLTPEPPPIVTPISNKTINLSVLGKGRIHLPALDFYCNEQHCNNIKITGENQKLIAIPNIVDYEFLGWGGQCSGQSKHYILPSSINDTIHCIAIFATKDNVAHTTVCPVEGRINHTCTSYNNKIDNAYIESNGVVDNALFSGITINYGHIMDSSVAPHSTLTGGGAFTGVILNKGIIKNIEFTGSHIIGGILEGSIINRSQLKYSIIRDVQLAPFTVLKGRSLAGNIIGDPVYPARLESLIITPHTYLEHVIIAQSVKVENNVIFGEGVIHEKTITPQARTERNKPLQIYVENAQWFYAQKETSTIDNNIEALYYLPANTVDTVSGFDEAYITTSSSYHTQALYPTIANKIAFYSTIEQRNTYYKKGFIAFIFNNQRYQGFLSYFIQKSSPTSFLRIEIIDDKNQDGVSDFMIYYPTGEQQILFNIPT